MSPALRIARRELRGGLSGFRVFLACLALGVAAIAAVGSVRSAIDAGLRAEGAVILGGDAEMRLTYRAATPEERAFMEARATAVSEVFDFRSMLTTTGPAGARDRALTQVKAVDAAYPLYGTVGLDPQMPLAEALAPGPGGLPGAVLDRALIDRLGLAVGDTVRLGSTAFRISAALTREPDAGTSGFSLGPRSIVARAALEGSGLLGPGTLYETDYRLRLPPGTDLAATEDAVQAAFPEAGIRWRDRRNGAPGLQRFVDRLGAFLVLVGLASLAVGGVGISAAVRAFLERKTDTIATLKTLGASGNTIFAIYFLQIGLLTLVGIALGLALGAGLPALLGPLLADELPVPALFDVYAAPLAEAALYGALTALIFTVWPLARARDIRAAGLFRDMAAPERHLPGWRYMALVAGLSVLLIGLACLFSGLWTLTLWSAFGVLATLGVLLAAAALTRRLARSAARARALRGRPMLRLALAAVGGPGGETASVVLSLGLGLTVLAAVGQIDANLREVISRELPDRAPAYFFVDIQSDQIDGFRARAGAEPGVERIDSAPMLRGIITRLHGVKASEAQIDPDAAWVLRGDRGVTYADTRPEGSTLTEGRWWPGDYAGPPLVSFAEEEGRELGLKLGDTLTVNVLGRDITAKVANFRTVDFRSMGINFLMVFNPGALSGAPHTHLATVYATPAAEAPLLRSLADAYPNITAIRVRDAIARVSGALGELSRATRWGAAAVLLTGFTVLIGAAAAGERRRVFEAAVLKTLGAGRGHILGSFAIRAAVLGAAAGAVAVIAGGLAGWAVMVFVMDAGYAFEPVSAVGIVAGGALASLLAGLGFALRPLAVRPARVLRARD
ncbi:FtsX-like permease family protein [Paroceanicella profunda]|uniref:FtsX-like permease family protein n=1 Tax=Paroceanicella profunda TaxID=2579971 RepID=A0A5B8FG34_9RHOB|nr:FtsX-like permease family protein [Paroceanicella profunda]QDL90731.1 FtsX-like permease family protein [Paroceanicella profunda]